MARKIRLFALGIAALASAGCMTIVNGTKQEVPVVTYPIRTSVRIVDSSGTTVFDGPTPAKVTLKRSEEYEFFAEAPGYKPTRLKASASTTRDNIWSSVLLNAFVTANLGLFVDIATGALREYDETGVELTLLREQGAAADDALEVRVTPAIDGTGTLFVALSVAE